MEFSAAAAELRRAELARLADCVPPSLGQLRTLTPGPFRSAVALMLERLGYDIINHPAAHDQIAIKDGKKFVIHCADPAEIDPTAQPALERLHAAVVAHGASSGFYITARAFTQQARDYKATAPIELVDGVTLEKSMRASLAGIQLPITYAAMCCECGDTVKHRLDKAEALSCANNHTVAPTIAQAALTPKEYPVERKRREGAPRYSRSWGRRPKPGR